MSVIVNGMFGVRIPYNADVIAAFRRALPGRRWDKEAQVWWMPVEDILKVADIVKPHFPSVAQRLLTSPRFEDVRNALEIRKENIAASTAVDANIKIPVPDGLTYLGYQKAGIAFAMRSYKQNPSGGVIIGDEMGLGKAQPLSAPILTPHGYTPMGNAYVGMPVVGRNGSTGHITGVFPQGVKATYRITFSDGTSTECCGDHLWAVNTAQRREKGEPALVKSLYELRQDIGINKWFIPTVEPVQFSPSGQLPTIPYLVGASLSVVDGHTQNMAGIPEIYKMASVEDRVLLLQGLMDSARGNHSLSGTLEYAAAAEQLATDIRFVVESLGGIVLAIHADEKENWILSFQLPSSVRPFLYSAKASTYTAQDGPPPCRFIAKVEYIGEQECQCISVSFEDHLYITNNFIVTHNTIQALGLLNLMREERGRPLKTLIVCPASLKYNWQREAQKWLVQKTPTLVMETSVPPAYMARTPVVIINYDIVKRFAEHIYAHDWDIIIFDESHYLKTPTAQRSKACRVIAHMPSVFAVLLSGTPILNRPAEIWHQLHVINPDRWATRFPFEQRYCAGGRFPGQGASNLGELQDILRAEYMVRRMKAEVLKELPPKMRQVIEIGKKGYESILKKNQELVTKLDEYQKQLDHLESQLANTAESSAKQRYEAQIQSLRTGNSGSLGEIARIRHETALAKVPEVIKFAENVLEQKDKVLIFAHHRDVIEMLHTKFKKNSVILYGGMSSKQKDEAVQKFRKDPNINVFIISIGAGREGLTLVESDTVIFAELDWTPSINQQCEDRVHRIGQENVVFIYHIVLEGSLDANIAKKCLEKQGVIDQAMNRKKAA